MAYNDDNRPLSAANPFFNDPASFGGGTQQRNNFYFPPRPLAAGSQAGGPSETPFPYPYTNETAAPFMENSFEWYDPVKSGGGRMPGRPPETGGAGRLEHRLIMAEKRLERFERDLERIDRRLRVVERRLGFPIPPGGIPGMPR